MFFRLSIGFRLMLMIALLVEHRIVFHTRLTIWLGIHSLYSEL